MKESTKPQGRKDLSGFSRLVKSDRVMPLGPGVPDKTVKPILESLTVEEAFAPQRITDRSSADLCLAGLWLRYDYLEECHRIAQELETEDAAYWHAIMHRREGDF